MVGFTMPANVSYIQKAYHIKHSCLLYSMSACIRIIYVIDPLWYTDILQCLSMGRVTISPLLSGVCQLPTSATITPNSIIQLCNYFKLPYTFYLAMMLRCFAFAHVCSLPGTSLSATLWELLSLEVSGCARIPCWRNSLASGGWS